MRLPLLSKSDLKYTFRQLRKKPGFTLLSILVLAGGLAVSIIAITLSYTLIYKTIPVTNGKAIHHICYAYPSMGCRSFKAYEFAQLRGDITTLENTGIYVEDDFDIEIGESFVNLAAVFTEWNMFALTGTRALLGRTLQAYDHDPGAEPVAVLSHGLWRRSFNGGEDVIGSTIDVLGTPTRIVGVMPEGYRFPRIAQIWLPVSPTLLDPLPGNEETVRTFALLREGVSAEAASDEIAALMRLVRERDPADAGRHYPQEFFRRLDQADTGHVQSIPMAALGGPETVIVIGFINILITCMFLLVCINVASLLLARTNERLKDVAIKAALGAPRRKLLLQTMGESTAICLAGGLLALLLAAAGLELVNLFFDSHPFLGERLRAFWMDFHVDESTLLAVLMYLSLTVYFTSVSPCRRLVNGEFNAIMRDGTRGALGRRAGRFSRSLVVVTVTLITLLVYVAAIAYGAVSPLKRKISAEDTANEVSAGVALPEEDYPAERRERFYRSLDNALRRDAAVAAVLMGTLWSDQTGLESTDASGTRGGVFARAPVMAVYGSLDSQEITLLEGRLLNAQDGAESPPAALVSRALAERLWPGRSPVGQNLRFADGRPGVAGTVWQVVGMVTDRPNMFDPLSSDTAMVYVPLTQVGAVRVSISVKARDSGGASRVNLERAAALLARAIRDFDPGIEFRLAYDEDGQRLLIRLINTGIGMGFGSVLFALLIALAGVYGLTQNAVALMTQEIGTRRALGASDGKVRRFLLKRGGRQLAIAFLAASLVISPLAYLTLFLMGPAFRAPVLLTIAAAMACLCTVVYLAIYYPVRNILKMEPADALRYE